MLDVQWLSLTGFELTQRFIRQSSEFILTESERFRPIGARN
jgi:hypothetical protein